MASAAHAAGSQPPIFDHAVLNLRNDLDAGETALRSLGFTLTDRGYHSLGSINHLIVFDGHYFELVGVDPANPNPRRELLDWPVGVNGLVFQTVDAAATHRRLSAQGLPAQPPKSFSRPVSIDGREHDARFRTVTMDREHFPAARLYFCEHQTPELIWRAEHMRHPNSAVGLRRIVVQSEQPHELAGRLAEASGAERLAPDRIACGDLHFEFTAAPGAPRIAYVGFEVRSLATLRASLDPLWSPHLVATRDHGLSLSPSQTFGVTLEFRETW